MSKLFSATQHIENPLIRLEAKAGVTEEDLVATLHFLGRFDPTLPDVSDQADPELIDALQRAAMIIQQALVMLEARLIAKEIAKAQERRRAIAQGKEWAREVETEGEVKH